MRDSFRIIDADRHVMEPAEMWSDYLPARMREYAPRLMPVMPPGETLAERLSRLGEYALLPPPYVFHVAGQPLMRGVSEATYIEVALIGERRRDLLAAAERPEGHIAEMDAAGIDVAVMLPTFAALLVYNDDADADRSREYARAYNRWLHDFCALAPTRLLGAALLSRHDPEAMVGDLEEALGHGMRAVVVRPNPVKGRTLSDPAYARFWAACEHHGVTILMHEGTHSRVPTAGADRFESHFGQHACAHPMEAMMAFVALVEGGVLETHPALRVGFLESGCGWLPYWLWRLDDIYAQHSAELRGRARRPPSEYFQRQCWIALEPTEAMLGPAVTTIGPERVVFGSDFPHHDHGTGIVDELMARRSNVGEGALREILWDSPSRLMGL
jgi:predicted TIM-barrel fold metal-dependent hydrolase